MNSTLLVSSVPEYIEKIISFPNFRFARGEPKRYEKPFLPKIWRPEFSHVDKSPVTENSELCVGELEILRCFQEKVVNEEIFDPYFKVFIGNIEAPFEVTSENLWHWASLAQHYGEPTRLADITSDCLVALYFACEKHSDENGYVHVFKSNFNEIDRSNLHLAVFGDTYFDVLAVKDDESDRYSRTPHGDTTTVILPSFPNRRVEAQKGAFCFTKSHGFQAYWGGQLTFEVNCQNNNKQAVLNQLARLGYSKETIYPKDFTRA